ncbi:CoA-transferase [uncultured Sneathiella sp.]|jgi:glutaconate CoA-transferase subunit B|uniref:CoA-transferase n=1 Tax=uncultured Sneathiella sp. TaxID=879315 RepID=UPI0030DC0B98|tara:strand:- start:5708 stop:6460 length:753 start_codon:yes stop_codon:yes gene_type:complete
MTAADEKKALICLIADLLRDCNHVAVGAASPIPGAAALLAKAAWGSPRHVNILGSVANNFFTGGGGELFDCAAQGRIDAFFLGGGQIDGEANINLMGRGPYPTSAPRWPGTFGSAYLYFLIPKVILFREEHTRRTLVEKVDFISAPGISDEKIYRKGGPYGLITSKAFFRFNREKRQFSLQSIHPSSSLEDILDNTGFAFDYEESTPVTPPPDPELLKLLETEVSRKVSEVYPNFAASIFPVTSEAEPVK